MDASQTFGCCDLGFDYSIKVSVTEELASSVNWLETSLSGEVDKTADKKQTELSSVSEFPRQPKFCQLFSGHPKATVHRSKASIKFGSACVYKLQQILGR